jgi:hypothetical protein
MIILFVKPNWDVADDFIFIQKRNPNFGKDELEIVTAFSCQGKTLSPKFREVNPNLGRRFKKKIALLSLGCSAGTPPFGGVPAEPC